MAHLIEEYRCVGLAPADRTIRCDCGWVGLASGFQQHRIVSGAQKMGAQGGLMFAVADELSRPAARVHEFQRPTRRSLVELS